MAVSVCFILGLLLWTSAEGSSSQPGLMQTNRDRLKSVTKGSSSQTRFIQTNGNLLLTVPERVQIQEDIFLWRFKNSNLIVRLVDEKLTTSNDYKGRVEFDPQNLSLMLKNVQLSDSGIYTAVVLRDRNEILATYDITVQAPVSEVQLSIDSVSNAPDSCNFTVSCKTQASSVSRSFSCDRHTCEESRPLTPSDHAPSLQLGLTNASITCNHSNHVSWTQDAKDIQQLCPIFGADDQQMCTEDTESVARWCAVKTVVFSVGLLLMASALVAVHVLECVRKKKNK